MEDLKLAPQPAHWIWNAKLIDDSSIINEECKGYGETPFISVTYSRDSWPNLVDWIRTWHATASHARRSRPTYDCEEVNVSLGLILLFDRLEHSKDVPWWPYVESAVEDHREDVLRTIKEQLGGRSGPRRYFGED